MVVAWYPDQYISLGGIATADIPSGINWLSDNIKLALVDKTAYTPNYDTDQYLSIISGILFKSVNLSGKAINSGVATAAGLVLPFVAKSAHQVCVVPYKDTGDSTTSPLVCLFDSTIVPNDNDITISWGTTTYKKYTL